MLQAQKIKKEDPEAFKKKGGLKKNSKKKKTPDTIQN